MKMIALAIQMLMLLAACSTMPSLVDLVNSRTDPRQVMLYKDPSCDCCDRWAEYLTSNGFTTRIVGVHEMQKVRAHYNVPEKFLACHTAIIDGYVFEGHVPVREIRRLLNERPEAVGLVVPRMPIGSPGMEVEGFDPQPYKVWLIKKDGSVGVYADYPKGGGA